ncbi:MAG: 2OG-Fe(II) oxygenase [Pseudomonadales bacterium]|nr:2OG-Fe(II) oxygenase [Pseudomonadales bacterium]MCP5330994.1 2OG-Fe(II) oxygenase [Pseudomonadales bacterium]MCP5344624.1 2OG-Fe(II) oxygenase [Pseudomonadales bacterium]
MQNSVLLHTDPVVYLIEGFLSDEEIAHIRQAGEHLLAPALVTGPDEGISSKGRTGRNCWIPHRHDEHIARVCERTSALVGLPLDNAESLQLIHYGSSQEYAPHFDAWNADSEAGKRCMQRGGQRLVTCLYYLNDVPAGGGTIFPRLKLEVAARKGSLLVFHNCLLGSNVRHPHSLHGGMPVLEGEKWACNLWFRERTFR